MKALRWFAVIAGACGGLGADPALAQIGPITYVTANSPLDSTDVKQVTVNCPPGLIAFSGGAEISEGQTLQLLLVQSLPQGTQGNPATSWLAMARERIPTAANWQLSAHAVCAEVAGFELVEATSPVDSSSAKLVEPECPPGKVPIGGGGGIFFANSPDLVLRTFVPTSNGFQVSARESAPFPGNWVLHAKVSCAAADVLQIAALTPNSFEIRDVLLIFCPHPRLVIGGGVESLDEAIYDSHPAGISGWEVGGRRLSENFWIVGGYALCWRQNVFADGFESGDTGAWSETEPWGRGGVR